MDLIAPVPRSPLDFCLDAATGGTGRDVQELALAAYDRVCRVDFHEPGFCLIDLGVATSSESLRRLMISLKSAMQRVHNSRTGRDLVYLSATRFDQQVSTKAHRDGGPDECFLILGYEPSGVRSDLAMADSSKCAFQMGLTPSEFLERHNPMFASGGQWLRSYTTPVDCFTNRHYQIVLINNSIAPYSTTTPAWQGVLHTATIHNPSDSLRRVVNSMMVASVPFGTPEVLDEEQLDEFVTTKIVRRRGYDRLHLEDES